VGFFIGVNISMEQLDMFEERDTTAYVYESPDGGNTIYRRKLMDPHYKRELVKQLEDEFVDYREWMYKQDWAKLSKHPGIKDYLDKLRTLTELVKEE